MILSFKQVTICRVSACKGYRINCDLNPDTPHGVNADYRYSYRKDKAEDTWKRMLAWFKKYGVA
ncbi:MAG TPA: dienelactone hydrolase family protein [Gemmataceae bacterium]|nr:dienelactone hydrolase family protein [Gemmataceae bacterium]